MMALAATFFAAGCAHNPTSAEKSSPPTPSATAVATALPTVFPALPRFSDWRVAYLAGDGRLHAITPDGGADAAGPFLPNLTSQAMILAYAGSSPDGRNIAYGVLGLTVFATSGQRALPQAGGPPAIADMAWSPDSAHVALGDRAGSFFVADVRSGRSTQIPPKAAALPRSLFGWIDETHLAVGDYQDPFGAQRSTTYVLSSLDVTSGDVRTITTVSSPGLGSPRITLSPDGKKALFSNARFRDYPFTPMVEEIDTASGSITPLPHIASLTQAGFSTVAWRTGTDSVAVSTGFLANNDARVWTLDLERDAAGQVMDGAYVAGWAPGGGPLIVSTANNAAVGYGPFTISALALAPNSQPKLTTLTRHAMTFPWLGFVRTA